MEETKKNEFALNAFAVLGVAAVIGLVAYAPENQNSPTKVVQFLKQNGFIEAKIEDAVHCKNTFNLGRKFVATNPEGEQVSGKVCGNKIENAQAESILSQSESTPRKLRM